MSGFKQISFKESVVIDFYKLQDVISNESGINIQNSQLLKMLIDTFKSQQAG